MSWKLRFGVDRQGAGYCMPAFAGMTTEVVGFGRRCVDGVKR